MLVYTTKEDFPARKHAEVLFIVLHLLLPVPVWIRKLLLLLTVVSQVLQEVHQSVIFVLRLLLVDLSVLLKRAIQSQLILQTEL